MIIDYEQRLKIEEKNILGIAELCQSQKSNWKENREFVEKELKKLYHMKFVSRDELASVTGLLAGGADGKLKTASGGIKFTRATDSNELFAQQKTPYIYPLLKAHKVPLEELKQVKPEEVYEKIPARLVVGMGSCQLSRIQSWLEHMLTPFSKEYGIFEYTKDTNSILQCIEEINSRIEEEDWDLKIATLFSVDVKALYPSVKLHHLKKALLESFEEFTDWSPTCIQILVNIIMYTLENQQIKWEEKLYMLNQGIPTGAKHCVPLANIFLTFIIKGLINKDQHFRKMFEENVKIWKRFIDDCLGMFLGRKRGFDKFYDKLKKQFKMYDLELTMEMSEERITMLDLEIYILDNKLHTKESRKETAANSYLHYRSAHPTYAFKGIIKSQLFRIRRLCSREEDFAEAVESLKLRCLNSGYDQTVVEDILKEAQNIPRSLQIKEREENEEAHKIRWVTLAHSTVEEEMENFVKEMNASLKNQKVMFELIKTTAPTLGKILFNNNNSKSNETKECTTGSQICSNEARGNEKEDSGIYLIT